MSGVRMHFWLDVARAKGGCSCPRKYGTNWFIPAFATSSPGTDGISEDDGAIRCPRSSKNVKNVRRISLPCIRLSVPTPPGASAQEVPGDQVPVLGGQAERFPVDALVVAVEHRRELGERHAVAEQPCPVCHRPRPAEEPGVRGADDHERDDVCL